MKRYSRLFIAAALLLFLSNCKKEGGSTPVKEITEQGKRSDAITGISPAVGVVYGAVEINGSGFDADTAKNVVTFDGVKGIINYATPTKLTVTIPLGATTGNVVVTVNGQFNARFNDYKIKQLVLERSVSFAEPEFNNTIYKLAADKLNKGGLYICNAESISYIAPNGVYKRLYNNPSFSNSKYSVTDIETDGLGNLYASLRVISSSGEHYADLGNYMLRIKPNGSIQRITNETPGFSNGPLSEAYFHGMGNVEMIGTGTAGQQGVYVADKNGIRRISPSGQVSTLKRFGLTGQRTASMGTIDTGGFIYGATAWPYQVLKMSPSGNISFVAGGSQQQLDGLGEQAGFFNITDLTMNNSDKLLLLRCPAQRSAFDKGNIRVINASGYVSTIPVPDLFDAGLEYDDFSQKLYLIYRNKLVTYRFK